MTPSARLQAAIEILDTYLDGAPVEKTLTNWARKSRYAGSKDRAAVRDIVFQCVRCRASYAALGGGLTGRGLAIGYAVRNPDGVELFDGSSYGPKTLSVSEKDKFKNKELSGDLHVDLDVPKWLLPSLRHVLGPDLEAVMKEMQSRASVFVRVNLSKVTRDQAISALAADGIVAVAHPLSATALEVLENPRRLNNSKALDAGLIDFQDVASQAVCQTIIPKASDRILDYCAGGGGKSLAFADSANSGVFAYDINHLRMSDISGRAARAGVTIKTLTAAEVAAKAPYDVVFCDVPCSGSGAWRRAPEGKWALTKEKLDELLEIQAKILMQTASLTVPDGVLAYATCSMLREENEDQIARFVSENTGWTAVLSQRFSPLDGGDGFFVAHLTRRATGS